MFEMTDRFDRILLDCGVRQVGAYAFDWFAQQSIRVKISLMNVCLRFVQHGHHPTLFVGGIQIGNNAFWTDRFSRRVAKAEIRRILGPVAFMLDDRQVSICMDSNGAVGPNAMPVNVHDFREQAALFINRALIAEECLDMGWDFKCEAYCLPGMVASNLPSISTDDMPDLPLSYDPTMHEIWVTGTPDPERLAARRARGQVHYIDSVLFQADQPLPPWWVTDVI